MEQLALIAGAALIIEKIIERVKETYPQINGSATSILALILSVGLVYGVEQLRILSLLFPDPNLYVDLAFSALAVAAGSGFVNSLEEFLKPSPDIVVMDEPEIHVGSHEDGPMVDGPVTG